MGLNMLNLTSKIDKSFWGRGGRGGGVSGTTQSFPENVALHQVVVPYISSWRWCNWPSVDSATHAVLLASTQVVDINFSWSTACVLYATCTFEAI